MSMITNVRAVATAAAIVAGEAKTKVAGAPAEPSEHPTGRSVDRTRDAAPSLHVSGALTVVNATSSSYTDPTALAALLGGAVTQTPPGPVDRELLASVTGSAAVDPYPNALASVVGAAATTPPIPPPHQDTLAGLVGPAAVDPYPYALATAVGAAATTPPIPPPHIDTLAAAVGPAARAPATRTALTAVIGPAVVPTTLSIQHDEASARHTTLYTPGPNALRYNGFMNAAFSPDGTHIAVATFPRGVSLVNLATNTVVSPENGQGANTIFPYPAGGKHMVTSMEWASPTRVAMVVSETGANGLTNGTLVILNVVPGEMPGSVRSTVALRQPLIGGNGHVAVHQGTGAITVASSLDPQRGRAGAISVTTFTPGANGQLTAGRPVTFALPTLDRKDSVTGIAYNRAGTEVAITYRDNPNNQLRGRTIDLATGQLGPEVEFSGHLDGNTGYIDINNGSNPNRRTTVVYQGIGQFLCVPPTSNTTDNAALFGSSGTATAATVRPRVHGVAVNQSGGLTATIANRSLTGEWEIHVVQSNGLTCSHVLPERGGTLSDFCFDSRGRLRVAIGRGTRAGEEITTRVFGVTATPFAP